MKVKLIFGKMGSLDVPNRKKQMIITALVKMDCIEICNQFGYDRYLVEFILKEYEVFCTLEINYLLRKYSDYSSFLLEHKDDFHRFLSDLNDRMQLNGFANGSTTNENDNFDDIYLCTISVQEIFLGSDMSRSFYYVIHVGYLNFSRAVREASALRTNSRDDSLNDSVKMHFFFFLNLFSMTVVNCHGLLFQQ